MSTISPKLLINGKVRVSSLLSYIYLHLTSTY